jgi:hypothetical protein
MEEARIKAREAGETRYESKLPCKRGHVGQRYTCNAVCVQCDIEVLSVRRRAKLVYVPRKAKGICEHCGSEFEKTNNANRHCSTECRFWSKVDKRGDDECWPWTGARLPFGHGQFNVDGNRGGKSVAAHRVAFELNTGVPVRKLKRKKWGDLYVCHTCDNPSCVNPKHLYLGSHATNMHDMNSRGRHGRAGPEKRYSESDVAAVLELRAAGYSQDKIAWLTGIPQTTVSVMLRGKY